MLRAGVHRWLWGMAATLVAALPGLAQDAPAPMPASAPPPPGVHSAPPVSDTDKPLPINLPTALQLVNARALDVAIASERIRVSAAQLGRSQVLWLPTIQMGTDYFRH